MKKRSVVVIGGGHGSATMLRGLKNIDSINLSSIVAVSDSGGSTGRLRQLYDMPAIGDIRNVMTALASQETIFNYLMNYRFMGQNQEEVDVIGHNLGNLILKALIDRHQGNLSRAILDLGQILKVKGEIIPSSLESLTLYARMGDGTIVKGEANIPTIENTISQVFFDHDVKASDKALTAIERADLVILGIGSLFTSILPNIIIRDIKAALASSLAPIVYYCNVMSEPGETDGFSMEDHVDMLAHHGLKVDGVVMAKDPIPKALVDHYKAHKQGLVVSEKSHHPYKVVTADLLTFDGGLVHHDPKKIEASFDLLVREFL